jgi:hypothetical protein
LENRQGFRIFITDIAFQAQITHSISVPVRNSFGRVRTWTSADTGSASNVRCENRSPEDQDKAVRRHATHTSGKVQDRCQR